MCDVFIFPTLSDGFGITQLEAMSYGLPVIASRNCGDIVQDQVNGLLLSDVTSDNIYIALYECIKDIKLLRKWSNNALKRIKDFEPGRIFPLIENMLNSD